MDNSAEAKSRVELIIFRIAGLVIAIAAIATQGDALFQKFAVWPTLAEDVKLVLEGVNSFV